MLEGRKQIPNYYKHWEKWKVIDVLVLDDGM